MVLGQIVEILPGDSLTIVSIAGDRKHFTWAELTSYERNGMRTEVPGVPAAPTVAAVPYVLPEPIQPGPGAPRLHIELTRPADLKLYKVTGEFSGFNYRGFSSGTTSAPVCAAPCDRVIDGRRGQSFFFNGDHVLKTRPFSLTEHSGDVVARVTPGRPARRVGGIIGLALGGAGLGTAAFLYWTPSATPTGSTISERTRTRRPNRTTSPRPRYRSPARSLRRGASPCSCSAAPA